MIKQARYSNGSREVVISASEPDVWLEATDSVINFPGLVELDGDNLFLSYHRGRHGGVEPLAGVVSSDLGATWQPAPDDFAVHRPASGHRLEHDGLRLGDYRLSRATARSPGSTPTPSRTTRSPT